MLSTLYLLASILTTEAGNQPVSEQYKVCDVVINRKNKHSSSLLTTMLQPHQFKHHKKPTKQSIAIAKECLSPSYKPTTPYLYFTSKKGHNHFRTTY